jgi:hypothetical protein
MQTGCMFQPKLSGKESNARAPNLCDLPENKGTAICPN